MRLLPWTTEEGKPCYLEPGVNGPSFMSKLADGMEAMQLGMGGELLTYVREILSAGEPPEEGWRYLVTALTGSLQDALRVAESRGERIRTPDEEDAEVSSAAQAVIDSAFIRSAPIDTSSPGGPA